MKKATPKAEVPAVLDTAVVKSTIDISMSSSDLINAIVEEKLELLEGDIARLNKELLDVSREMSEHRDKFNTIIDDLHAREHVSVLKEFTKFYNKQGIKLKMSLFAEYSTHDEEGKSDMLEFTYHFSERYVDDMEKYDFNSKQSLSRLPHRDAQSANWKEQAALPRKYVYQIRSEDKKLLVFEKKSVLPKTEIALYKALLLALFVRKNRIIKELHDAKVEHLTYLYGKDRIKARIVKANLEKSKEGKEILARLLKVTKL